MRLILASTSPTRASMLSAAGVPFATDNPRLDETSVTASLVAEGASPRDIADTLAEMKAMRVSARHPDALVLGADQVLDLDGQPLGKPDTARMARDQLLSLRGKTHRLFSAAVICRDGRPEWRQITRADMTVRDFSDHWLDGYLSRNLPDILGSAGGYRIESEGVRLFTAIAGDHFTILGLPLIPLLGYLATRGVIEA
jgi:septum formation protein